MPPSPRVVVFGVNQTLSDMAPMAVRFAGVGAPACSHGAPQAGMRTGWISRQQAPYSGYFAAPDLQAPDLSALAGQVLS